MKINSHCNCQNDGLKGHSIACPVYGIGGLEELAEAQSKRIAGNFSEGIQTEVKGLLLRGIIKMDSESREELRMLIQAETQRMKDDRKRMMKEGRKHLMWIAALLSILAIYEIWIIPWLEVYLGIKK